MGKTNNVEITQGICSVDGQEPSEFTQSIMERVSKGEISPNEGTRLMNEHFQKLVGCGRLEGVVNHTKRGRLLRLWNPSRS